MLLLLDLVMGMVVFSKLLEDVFDLSFGWVWCIGWVLVEVLDQNEILLSLLFSFYVSGWFFCVVNVVSRVKCILLGVGLGWLCDGLWFSYDYSVGLVLLCVVLVIRCQFDVL